MAIQLTHKDTSFGVGDIVRVHQRIEDINPKGEARSRVQIFEGTVLGINNRGEGRTFLVRKIGANNIGIEQIFPVNSPLLEKVEVTREGKRGVTQAKIYYTREKSKREIEKIYTRAKRRGLQQEVKKAEPKKVASKKKVSPKKKVIKKASK